MQATYCFISFSNISVSYTHLSKVGLDKLNIELHRNGVKVDEHLLTSHPRVYACGDITGYSLLAHTAIREAEVAINHILGVEDRMNYDCVPGVVYTNPEAVSYTHLS